MVERYVAEDIFRMKEADVRELFHEFDDTIGIHYAFPTYSCSVNHIIKLRDAVHADYPEMKDDDMDVWVIATHESIRHAKYTTLWVRIPVDDYFKFKAEHKIWIR